MLVFTSVQEKETHARTLAWGCSHDSTLDRTGEAQNWGLLRVGSAVAMQAPLAGKSRAKSRAEHSAVAPLQSTLLLCTSRPTRKVYVVYVKGTNRA